MPVIQFQVAITVGDEAAKAIAEVLGPALKQAAAAADSFDERREARLRASKNALFAGEEPPEDQGLLIDSRQAAKLLNVSERTLWEMAHSNEMPPAIRIGRAVRFSVDALKKWVDAGCPRSSD